MSVFLILSGSTTSPLSYHRLDPVNEKNCKPIKICWLLGSHLFWLAFINGCRLEDIEFSESEIETIDVERADRGVFVQELLLATDVGEIMLDDVTDITAPQTSHSDCNVDKREIIAPSPSTMAKLPKAECDAKPVTIPEVRRECAPRKFASVTHPHPEKNETRVQKTRLLPQPKVLKYRGSKESAPPLRK